MAQKTINPKKNYAQALKTIHHPVIAAQTKLRELEKTIGMTISEIKEINRQMSQEKQKRDVQKKKWWKPIYACYFYCEKIHQSWFTIS